MNAGKVGSGESADGPSGSTTAESTASFKKSEQQMPALSASAILAQSRSLIVDMLQICGWSRESAVAVLKPTSTTPAYPPEVRGSFFSDSDGDTSARG